MPTKLIRIALIVGATAVAMPFAGDARAADVDLAKLTALAQAVARSEDRVSAATLNDWIIQDRRDYALIDLRPPAEFQAGHIKGAVNMTVARLFDRAEFAKLAAAPRLVVYANGTDMAAQAATLLRLAGVRAVSLSGGFVYWAEHSMDLKAATGGDEGPDAAKRAAIIRALNNCPRLPEAKIPPLLPVSVTPAPAVEVPGRGPPPGQGPEQRGPKQDVPIILEKGCG
jgi:rhodanese-related sulfurtransferase